MEPDVETKVLADSRREPRDLTAGHRDTTKLGRYELVQRLGHGGMATVYLALTRGLANFQKLVAVKVIHPHLANEPAFVDMFLSEARIAALLHNPHIGEILDIGRADGLYYMVMEYIEGETLSSLVRVLQADNRRLPTAVVLQILADTCYGLEAVHDLRDTDGEPLGLVHRDVSPQNLLITLTGWVKLVDFGIAKAAGRESSTLTGCLRGKLPYMPPEQAQGQPLTCETDLFALGVIAWELLAGRRLYTGANEAETLKRVLACEVESLTTIRPDLPRALVDVVDRALARDPDQRPHSASQLRGELLAILRDEVGEQDPRAMLAELMRTSFGERHDYRRATVRRTAKHPVIRVVEPHDVSDGTLTPPRTRNLALVPPVAEGESQAALAVEDVYTQNTPGGSPWPLWLGLPLVGAAIAGAAFFLGGFGQTSQQPRPAPVATQPPIVEPVHSKTEVPSAVPPATPVNKPPESIAWVIQTTPPGATISVVKAPDAVRPILEAAVEDAVTPIRLELPRGSTEIGLVLEKVGFEAVHDLRMPIANANLSFALKAKRPKARTHFKTAAKTEPADAQDPKTPPDPLETPTFKPLKTKPGHPEK